jgi:hypothetical protein
MWNIFVNYFFANISPKNVNGLIDHTWNVSFAISVEFSKLVFALSQPSWPNLSFWPEQYLWIPKNLGSFSFKEFFNYLYLRQPIESQFLSNQSLCWFQGSISSNFYEQFFCQTSRVCQIDWNILQKNVICTKFDLTLWFESFEAIFIKK